MPAGQTGMVRIKDVDRRLIWFEYLVSNGHGLCRFAGKLVPLNCPALFLGVLEDGIQMHLSTGK
jgi:hypothetical protein